MKNYVKEIRQADEDYKHHIAEVILQTDHVKIVDWKNPNCSHYSIRFIFDNYKMIITGDLGQAIFNLTWKPNFSSKWTESLDYLLEKKSIWTEDHNAWNQDEFIKDIEQYMISCDDSINQSLLDEVGYEISDWNFDKDICRHKAYEVLFEEYPDIWESIDYFGEVKPLRFIYWIRALQLISKQLRNSGDSIG